MAKKKKQRPGSGSPSGRPQQPGTDAQATLKERLSGEVLDKLKLQAQEWKKEEAARKEQERQRKEEERRAEQERLENDFAYLLNNSNADWRKFK
ncbi:DUF3886 domain-containing protein [Xylanibacillus composti]|uniref:DUF3886 domain-containing protein n=1 Tax=Xylanibacillus composti TaxID=1572762 RepID=A0A8J4M129_9BACL|nr:YqkE family protein [Xylanibacillus composti]MDT9726224.1 DUF3886 domain-containing protein [Xylanibacillus composti]GIQ68074.1 hypothetical protein XYCOK13_08980 [Xylanibacillus composti]